jgi:putative cardiolipin synthase
MAVLSLAPDAAGAGPRLVTDARVATIDAGPDAFAARQVLAHEARRTLDLQYFIWEGDVTGSTLMGELIAAADRGVKVRMLLDDASSSGIVGGLTKLVLRHTRAVSDKLDEGAGIVGLREKRWERKDALRRLLKDLRSGGRDTVAAALASHPNIEVRYFNPFRARGLAGALRAIEFLGDFWRLNRRMHNKAFIMDRRVAVMGGRNVSDSYFGYGERYNFRDLDLLVEGPAVTGIASDFDAYWNSPQAVPAHSFWLDRPARKNLDVLREELAHFWETSGDRPTLADAMPRMARVRKGLISVKASVVSDSPRKAERPSREVAETLEKISSESLEEVLIEHAYFIPTSQEFPDFERALQRGVRVRVLTNSASSNDNMLAAAGYKRHRTRVVRMGVELHELRPDNHLLQTAGRGGGVSGMHTKAAVFDGRRVFVGTFNLDPRSASLNTEIGLLIESRALAAQVSRRIHQGMQEGESWVVIIDKTGKFPVAVVAPGGRLAWIGGGRTKTHFNEPQMGLWRRIKLTMLSWLPLDPLL